MVKLVSLNSRGGVKNPVRRNLIQQYLGTCNADLFFMQEHWLCKQELYLLNEIDDRIYVNGNVSRQ